VVKWTPFCDLISLFSSLKFDREYELSFWNEIYGCVSYLNLPYETVMSMPTYIRKFWIQKHNRVAQEMDEGIRGPQKGTVVDGEAVNAYAAIEQGNAN